MRVTIVKASELEPCWSAYRFTEMCFQCDKYFTCKHEVRIVDEKFEQMTKEFMAAKKKYKTYMRRKFNGKLQHMDRTLNRTIKEFNKEVTA